jgi:hypothetical protein
MEDTRQANGRAEMGPTFVYPVRSLSGGGGFQHDDNDTGNNERHEPLQLASRESNARF